MLCKLYVIGLEKPRPTRQAQGADHHRRLASASAILDVASLKVRQAELYGRACEPACISTLMDERLVFASAANDAMAAHSSYLFALLALLCCARGGQADCGACSYVLALFVIQHAAQNTSQHFVLLPSS